MKVKRIMSMTLALTICLNVLPISGEAFNIPKGQSSTYYTQFIDVLMGFSETLKGTELIDFTGDQIPELVLIYSGVGSELCVEIYQSDATALHAAKLFSREYSAYTYVDESSMIFGKVGTQEVISAWYSNYVDEVEGYDFTIIDKHMNETSIALRQYHTSTYDFIDSRGNSMWDFFEYSGGDPETDKLLNEFYKEYHDSEYSYYKDDMKISKSEYDKLLQTFEINSVDAQIPDCYSSYHAIDKKEPILMLLDYAVNAQAEEAATQIIQSNYSVSNVMDSLSDSEEIELLEFMGLFNSFFGYVGTEFEAKKLLPTLYLAMIDSGYYSSRYDYQKDGCTLKISIDELDRLVLDAFNMVLTHENITLGDVEFSETLTMSFDEDMITIEDNGYYWGNPYCFEKLMGLYQLSDNIYYGIFRGTEFDCTSPLGFAILQKRDENGVNYWRCLYANLDGEALSADTLQQYIIANTSEPEEATNPTADVVAISEVAVSEPTTQQNNTLIISFGCVMVVLCGGLMLFKKRHKHSSKKRFK